MESSNLGADLKISLLISLPFRKENLTIALENWNKSAVRLSIESPILLNLVNLCQQLCKEL